MSGSRLVWVWFVWVWYGWGAVWTGVVWTGCGMDSGPTPGFYVGHGSALPEQLWPPLGPGSSETATGSAQPVEGRAPARELGVGSPWLICSSPARAIISASLSQVEGQAWDEEGCTAGDMIAAGSSSFLEPIA